MCELIDVLSETVFLYHNKGEHIAIDINNNLLVRSKSLLYVLKQLRIRKHISWEIYIFNIKKLNNKE